MRILGIVASGTRLFDATYYAECIHSELSMVQRIRDKLKGPELVAKLIAHVTCDCLEIREAANVLLGLYVRNGLDLREELFAEKGIEVLPNHSKRGSLTRPW